MPSWLARQVAGPNFAPAVLWTLLALVVLVIVLVVVRIVRSMTFGTFVAGGRNRKTRLAVMDAAAVDSQRRLVLVRRDDIEHLILIGGPTDVVVERDIRLHASSRRPAAAPAASAAHAEPAAELPPRPRPPEAPTLPPRAERPPQPPARPEPRAPQLALASQTPQPRAPAPPPAVPPATPQRPAAVRMPPVSMPPVQNLSTPRPAPHSRKQHATAPRAETEAARGADQCRRLRRIGQDAPETRNDARGRDEPAAGRAVQQEEQLERATICGTIKAARAAGRSSGRAAGSAGRSRPAPWRAPASRRNALPQTAGRARPSADRVPRRAQRWQNRCSDEGRWRHAPAARDRRATAARRMRSMSAAARGSTSG